MSPAWPLDSAGAWREIVRRAPPGRPALFLDRDGVVVEEVEYLSDPAKVSLCRGIAKLIARANRSGVAVVIVTNQSGIARGYYGWAQFHAVQQEIARRLAAEGAAWDAVMASPFHPEGRAPWRSADHPSRKPNPGMLLAAAEAMRIELGGSAILGDRATDMQAGRRAGLSRGYFLGEGYHRGEIETALAASGGGFTVRRAVDPADALADLGAFFGSASA